MRHNTQKDIVCPFCKGHLRRGIGLYHCDYCQAKIELNTEEFLDDDEPIFFSPYRWIEDRGRATQEQEVVNWLQFHHPEWHHILSDSRFLRFIEDFDRYNHWLNHGNEPSIRESVEDGDFEDMVQCILGNSDSLAMYFRDNRENMAPGDTDEELDMVEDEFARLRAVYGNRRGF